MAIIASTTSGLTRELTPAGNHVARCFRMIHIGTYEDEYMGEPKVYNKVRLTWELTNELRVFNEEKGEQPMVIDKEYTLSMGEKANLRKDLESWRGKGFTEEEAEGFDITKLLDKFCMLNIIHKTSGKGKEYAFVASIAPMPKGMPEQPKYNEVFVFDYDTNFDPNFVDSLPEFIKEPMMASKEYKMRMSELYGKEQENAAQATAEPLNDDLPF